jgi:hypothetical protein
LIESAALLIRSTQVADRLLIVAHDLLSAPWCPTSDADALAVEMVRWGESVNAIRALRFGEASLGFETAIDQLGALFPATD